MRSTVVLAVLVLALALTISRLGLVAHELVGHGAVAAALGGQVVAWRLHAFGGGWLDYQRPPDHGAFTLYAVDTGGIAIEVVLAAACALVARRLRGTPQLAFSGAAWALVIHFGFYLAAGTFHGFGDGWLLHQRLGDDRLWIVIPAALVTVVAAYLGAVRLATRLRAHGGLAVVATAMALGLAAHGALAATELALRSDREYTATMRTAAERAIERDLAARVAAAEAVGRPLDAPQVDATRSKLEDQHRQFPFRILLIVAIGLAAAVGVARSRPDPAPRPLPPRVLAIACAIATGAIALVVVLDRLAP